MSTLKLEIESNMKHIEAHQYETKTNIESLVSQFKQTVSLIEEQSRKLVIRQVKKTLQDEKESKYILGSGSALNENEEVLVRSIALKADKTEIEELEFNKTNRTETEKMSK